ncbi:hypothetical protein [Hymenobacter cellulosilyticus]|uniref:Uncharacterized protein n=1 Tax=Hymenobacter cellulosilyticus TaxID=2932248 RepID=A0A8T9Q3R8_9BACT|nr:hypothetical protein [Hymenobacter cellulosilyticus]UOQ72376.1 hypothetical protein MUN79_28200 [Hymenobacter cellulosilyticus]
MVRAYCGRFATDLRLVRAYYAQLDTKPALVRAYQSRFDLFQGILTCVGAQRELELR